MEDHISEENAFLIFDSYVIPRDKQRRVAGAEDEEYREI